MSFDRTIGWARQGFEHPAPWAESVPDDWADTMLHFTSSEAAPVLNDVGGFSGSATPSDTATLQGRAELVAESGLAIEAGGAPYTRRYYRLFVPLPLPTGAVMPDPGQRVWFLDALGRTIDVAINHVDVYGSSTADHLEITTEDVE